MSHITLFSVFLVLLCLVNHALCAVCPLGTDTPKFCQGGLAQTCLHGTCVAVNAGGIPFERCECHAGTDWEGKNCDFCCDLDCNVGNCSADNTLQNPEKFCICDDNDKVGGEFCNVTKTTTTTTTPKPITITVTVEDSTPEIIGGSVGGGLLLAMVVIVIALVILYKKRYSWITNVLYKLHLRRSPESFRFDIFVSYCSSGVDEHFVAKTLLPTLENDMGFKVCIHFRDFDVGNYIVDNIIWGIENSQRSLLVLSPDFLKSDWARYEVVTAHHRMVNLEHRIIPFIFRDIGPVNNLQDRVIRNILETITYIEWPKEGSKNSTAVNECWRQLRRVLRQRIPRASSSTTPGGQHGSNGDVESVGTTPGTTTENSTNYGNHPVSYISNQNSVTVRGSSSDMTEPQQV